MHALQGPDSIITIDCKYIRPRTAAAFLLLENDRVAFIENNTARAVDDLIAALHARNLKEKQVEFIIITHVHLDHAGGTAALLERCPNAVVLAHPRAARHIIDPARLIAGTKEVYGEEQFTRLYGEIKGVPESRVRTMADDESLVFGNRTLRFLHTRGHANHHFCIHDSESNGVFTGDSFGIAYPDLRVTAPFVFASTTPTDFAPDEATASIQRILDTGAERVFLTHYGVLENPSAVAPALLAGLATMKTILEEATHAAKINPNANLQQLCEDRIWTFFRDELVKCGIDPDRAREFLTMDLEMNAMGIASVAARQRRGQ